MTESDKMGAFLRRYDPAADIGCDRLGALELSIMSRATLCKQGAVPTFFPFGSVNRTQMARWTGMACLMMMLGMLTGQSLFYRTSFKVQAMPSPMLLAVVAPWQTVE